jgi:hypothetical protein
LGKSKETRRGRRAYGGTAHSGAKVPIYSFGPGAELFRGEIDNTEIARNIAKLWGFEIPVVGSAEAKQEAIPVDLTGALYYHCATF